MDFWSIIIIYFVVCYVITFIWVAKTIIDVNKTELEEHKKFFVFVVCSVFLVFSFIGIWIITYLELKEFITETFINKD